MVHGSTLLSRRSGLFDVVHEANEPLDGHLSTGAV